jgi:hypothetical protein
MKGTPMRPVNVYEMFRAVHELAASKGAGSAPALNASNRWPASSRSNASAIMLRAEFSRQRNCTLNFPVTHLPRNSHS